MQRLTSDDFNREVIRRREPAIVMFFAPWCGKCAMMRPVFEALGQRYRGRIRFFEVSIEESGKLTAAYGAGTVPTFIMFRGGRPISALQGIMSQSVFEQRIQKIFRNS